MLYANLEGFRKIGKGTYPVISPFRIVPFQSLQVQSNPYSILVIRETLVDDLNPYRDVCNDRHAGLHSDRKSFLLLFFRLVGFVQYFVISIQGKKTLILYQPSLSAVNHIHASSAASTQWHHGIHKVSLQ